MNILHVQDTLLSFVATVKDDSVKKANAAVKTFMEDKVEKLQLKLLLMFMAECNNCSYILMLPPHMIITMRA